MLQSLYIYQEINHLSKEEQELLIQRAKYEAYTTLGQGTIGITYFIFSLALAVLSNLVLANFLPVYLSSLIAVSSFFISYQVLYKSIISKGLKSILAKQ